MSNHVPNEDSVTHSDDDHLSVSPEHALWIADPALPDLKAASSPPALGVSSPSPESYARSERPKTTTAVEGHAEAAVVPSDTEPDPSAGRRSLPPRPARLAGHPREGVAQGWTSYKDFQFTTDSADLPTTDMTSITRIAEYLGRNASLLLGIDGHVDPAHPDIGSRRINSVRTNLIKAGLPNHKIRIGSFGDPKLQSEGRVEVLVRSGR